MSDPWEILSLWYEQACASEPRVPDAMQLATADARGRPSVRTVLLKAFGPGVGLVFYTNLGSRKAIELAANPRAAVCLHWKGDSRQVLAEGPVERVDDAASDAYFATRPLASRLGAWASRQSEPLPSRAVLAARVAQASARFAGRTVTRPPFWGGLRVIPERFEFWSDRQDRLHHRQLFVRESGEWRRSLLYP